MSPLQLILLSSSYSGTYWSYDACFTPARTDQLCQLVVAEGRTKCNTLSGTGRREVARSCSYLWCFHELLFLLFLLIKSIPPAVIWPTSNHNVVFFKSKRKNLCPRVIWQVCCCLGKAVSYHSSHPSRKKSWANVSISFSLWVCEDDSRPMHLLLPGESIVILEVPPSFPNLAKNHTYVQAPANLQKL